MLACHSLSSSKTAHTNRWPLLSRSVEVTYKPLDTAQQRPTAHINRLSTAGDVLARWWPNSGRIITAQLSVLLSLPLSCLLLKGLPTHDVGHRLAMRNLYAVVMFLFGLCISW